MSANISYRPFVRFGAALAISFACLVSTGCNPFTAIYFLFLLPPPKVEAACDKLEKQKVVVLCYATRGAQFEYSGIDNDLAKGIVRELKENVKGIKLAEPNEVRQWRDENADFELTDVGEHFKSNRVLYVEIESFTLYEQQSTELYRGAAKIHMQVVDMEEDGEVVWDNVLDLQFPPSRPIPASDMSRDKFRLLFLKYMTRQVAHHFFEYRPDEDFVVN